jgi:hypothetical protein
MAPGRRHIEKRCAVAKRKTINRGSVEEEKSIDDTASRTTAETNTSRKEDEGDGLEEHRTGETSPAGNEILVPDKDGQEKSLSALSETNVDKNGTLSIIQKSMIANWAEEHFLRANKIMTYEEAAKHEKLPDALCLAMNIRKEEWSIVGSEAIRKLRSVMSDKLSVHRKIVKQIYTGECFGYCVGQLWYHD